MEKQGIVQAGTTPDIESKLAKPTEKKSTASSQSQTRELDNDARKRASDTVARHLR